MIVKTRQEVSQKEMATLNKLQARYPELLELYRKDPTIRNYMIGFFRNDQTFEQLLVELLVEVNKQKINIFNVYRATL